MVPDGLFDEGINWVTNALEDINDVPDVIAANVYNAAGEITSFFHNDNESSVKFFQNALEIYQKLSIKREIGWVHNRLTYSSMMISDPSAVQENFDKSNLLFRELDDKVGIADALPVRFVPISFGDLTNAKKSFEEGLEIAQETGDKLRESICLLNIACVLLANGDERVQNNHLKDSLRLEIAIGHSQWSGTGLLSYLAGTACFRPTKASSCSTKCDRISI